MAIDYQPANTRWPDDSDIDLPLDDREQIRIRPAQASIVASRTALGGVVLTATGVFYGGLTGALTVESKALPLLTALLLILAAIAYGYSSRADRIDTPAICNDDDQEV